MIIGTTLNYPGGTSIRYYSPQFPRGGMAAVFSIETEFVVGSPTLQVDVEHRNEDDTSWTVAGSFSGITAAGVSTADVTSLKEMIRLSYRFTAGVAAELVHVIVPAPAWRPY